MDENLESYKIGKKKIKLYEEILTSKGTIL